MRRKRRKKSSMTFLLPCKRSINWGVKFFRDIYQCLMIVNEESSGVVLNGSARWMQMNEDSSNGLKNTVTELPRRKCTSLQQHVPITLSG